MAEAEPVLVVGAGPTGLTAAIELARREVPVRIVDREPKPVQESRALVVQPRTLEVWLDQGVAADALGNGLPAEAARVRFEGAQPVRIELSGMGGPFDAPLILPQDETERILGERLAELGVEIERETTLTALDRGLTKPRAELSTPEGSPTLAASWVVGADGAHSTVRDLLGLPFEGVPYADRFVVADVDAKTDLAPGEIHAWTREGRILLVIPLRRPGHYRIVTTQRPEDQADPDETPSRARLQAWIDETVEARVEIEEPRWRSIFRVHCRGVPDYRVGRVLLAGDAAHIHSPAGGQGMNTGIQDAYNLGWKLALVHRGQAPPALLDTYHEERHPVGQRLLSTTDRLFQVGTAGIPGSTWLRRWLVRPLLARDAVQKKLRRFVSQRAIRYRGSPLANPERDSSRLPWRGDELQSGDPAPDGPIRHDGRRQRLLEVLAGTRGHVLLVFEGTRPQSSPRQRAALLDDVAQRAPAWLETSWTIVHGPPPPDQPALVDVDAAVHEAYGRGEPGYEILRPDGHLGARVHGHEIDGLEAYADPLASGGG